MASKVTTDDIIRMNREYFECKNYSEVARRVGFSASTVRKYVDKNWTPAIEEKRIIFDPQRLSDEFDSSIFKSIENYGELCVLSEEEYNEIKRLWEELEV